MRTRLCSLCSNLAFAAMLMIGTGMIVSSCQDDLLEDSYPSWLGSSIYGELGNRGNFKYTLRLIDDLDYASVLSKTGSKTLFVADDDSWDRFFASDNNWGVKSYDQLSIAQKKWLLKSAMLSSAYLGEKLSTVSLAAGIAGTGTPVALRRANSTSPVDSISLYVGTEAINNLPTGPIGSSYWSNLKKNALRTGQDTVRFSFSDDDAACMVHFPQDLRSNKNMTDEDVKFIFGVSDVANIYIFGDPIVEQDITCQNGYVHVMKDLLVAPDNLDKELKKITNSSVDKNTSVDPNVVDASLFSSLLDRYTIPVAQSISGGVTTYRKAYFSDDAARNSTSATANNIYSYRVDSSGTAMALISFDPSWHRYAAESGYQLDMPVMFVPTTGALNEWRKSTTGQLVMPSSKYPTWDDVPEDLLNVLINNHMKGSFFGALPSVFSKVLNDGGREQKISKSDVLKTVVTNNGVIYMVNQVYTPDAYVSVFAPCLNVEELTIMNYAVTNTDKSTYIPKGYQVYLNNMESSFSFFAPTNEALSNYRDPSYTSEDETWRRISFGYSGSAVTSTPQIMNADGSVNGLQSPAIGSTLQASLLKDILENSIVVMSDADWSHGGWFKTKGGGMVYVTSFAQGGNVYSGGNLEMQETAGIELPTVEVLYDQTKLGNGMTCQLTQPIQPTLNSVIKVLQNHSEFSEFADLMLGSDSTLSQVEFASKPDSLKLYQPLVTNSTSTSVSRGQRVGFLSSYNYTLYAPNNAAMDKAYQQGLPTWDEVNALTDLAEKKRKAKQIMAFIRTHFQDNSVCTDGTGGDYKSQAFNSEAGIFYQLQVTTGGTMKVQSLNDTDANKEIASVYSTNLSNMQAREYVFDGKLSTGSTAGAATTIAQSSYVVVHGIDTPLFFSARENGSSIRTQFK